MTLPIFKKQPDEKKDYEPKVMSFLNNNSLESYVIGGLFDLLVCSPAGRADSYIELKIRLSSQGMKCPISPNQWDLISNINVGSRISDNWRALIYDQNQERYALASINNLLHGVCSNQPSSTSYITTQCLNDLGWASAAVTSKELLSWIRR